MRSVVIRLYSQYLQKPVEFSAGFFCWYSLSQKFFELFLKIAFCNVLKFKHLQAFSKTRFSFFEKFLNRNLLIFFYLYFFSKKNKENKEINRKLKSYKKSEKVFCFLKNRCILTPATVCGSKNVFFIF